MLLSPFSWATPHTLECATAGHVNHLPRFSILSSWCSRLGMWSHLPRFFKPYSSSLSPRPGMWTMCQCLHPLVITLMLKTWHVNHMPGFSLTLTFLWLANWHVNHVPVFTPLLLMCQAWCVEPMPAFSLACWCVQGWACKLFIRFFTRTSVCSKQWHVGRFWGFGTVYFGVP